MATGAVDGVIVEDADVVSVTLAHKACWCLRRRPLLGNEGFTLKRSQPYRDNAVVAQDRCRRDPPVTSVTGDSPMRTDPTICQCDHEGSSFTVRANAAAAP